MKDETPVLLFVYAIASLISLLIFYSIIKAAVKNAMLDAWAQRKINDEKDSTRSTEIEKINKRLANNEITHNEAIELKGKIK